MLFEVLSILIIVGIVIIFVFPLVSMVRALLAMLTGRYLNRYFIVIPKGNGVYALHHHPSLGFYYASERKYRLFLKDAIEKFNSRYPDLKLIATTFLFQGPKMTPIQMNRLTLTGARFMNDFLVLTNLANYRKVNGKWRFVSLIQRIHRKRLMLLELVGG